MARQSGSQDRDRSQGQTAPGTPVEGRANHVLNHQPCVGQVISTCAVQSPIAYQ
jgi:hypothetical protein